MHKFGRSKHEIYYKLLVFLTYHWSCYFELKIVIIHNKVNYSCTISDGECSLNFVWDLPLVPEEGLLAYTKLCSYFYLFTPTPLPPFNDNFISQSNATKFYHL